MKTKPNARNKTVQASELLDSSLLRQISNRLVRHASNNLVVKPNIGVVIKELHDNPATTDAPYGALPFAMSATTEELIEAAAECNASKYWFMEKGDYYNAWRCGHRQRLFERLLQSTTRFGLTS
jgi:hypothetical protein